MITPPRQPPRPARDGGRPPGARRGLALPGPFAGRLLGLAARPDARGCPPPRPSRSRRTGRPGFELRPQPGRGGSSPASRCPSSPGTYHYIRDGEGGEKLYDPIEDPHERKDLTESAEKKPVVATDRAMLLDVLNEEPGSDAVERTYLRAFRESLAALVRPNPGPRTVVTETSVTPDGPAR